MAQGSYAPIYTHIKRALLDANERLALEVLEGFSWFTDDLGLCYPSPRRVAEVIHRSPLTVERELEKLVDWGFMRLHVTENKMRRGKPQMDYQINPAVLYIREELEPQAIALFGDLANVNAKFKNELSLGDTQPNNQNQEPESNPKPESKIKTHHHHPSTNRESGLSEGASDEAKTTPSGSKIPTKNSSTKPDSTHDSAKRQQDQREAPTKRQDSSSAAAPASRPPSDGVLGEKMPSDGVFSAGKTVKPSSDGAFSAGKTVNSSSDEAKPRDLSAFAVPLAEFEHEQLAQYLRDAYGMQLRQTRALVHEYGYQTVDTGVAWVKRVRETQEVRNPAGLLVSWLRRKTIDAPPPPEQNRFLSGKYADFFDK